MTPNAALPPPRRPRSLLALVAALLLFRLGAVPLLGPDEPRYARVAVEMHRARRLGHARRSRASRGSRSRPLLLAGRGRVLASSARPRRRPGCPRCSRPLCSSGATALVGARLYGAAAGLHAGFILATSPARRSPTAAPRPWTCCWRPRSRPRSGCSACASSGIAGPLAVPAAGACAGPRHAGQGPARACCCRASWSSPTCRRARRRRPGARELPRPRRSIALRWSSPGPGTRPSAPPRASAFVDVFLLNHNLAALHVHHPQPSRARLLLRARAPGRPLPVVGPDPARAWRVASGRASARTSSSCCWLRARRSSSSPPPAPSCPATSCPACRRSRSLRGAPRTGSATPSAPVGWARRRRPRRPRAGRAWSRGAARPPPAMGEPAVAWPSRRRRCGRSIAVPRRLAALSRRSRGRARASCASAPRGFLLLLTTRGAAAPGAPRIGTRPVPARRGARGAGLGRLAHGLDGRATSTTTAGCARSRRSPRSRRRPRAGRSWCSAGPAELRILAPPVRGYRGQRRSPRARASRRSCRLAQRLLLEHADDACRRAPGTSRTTSSMNDPHEEDPAAVGLQEVLLGHGIGHRLGVEARALVLRPPPRGASGWSVNSTSTRFASSMPVAVLDRVHHRLAHGHAHVVDGVLVEAHDARRGG